MVWEALICLEHLQQFAGTPVPFVSVVAKVSA